MNHLLKTRLLATLFILLSTVLLAQEEFLPRSINHTAKNNIIPSISADGKMLIFLTNHSNTGEYVLEASQYSEGRWKNAKEITALNPIQLINRGSYFLDNRGKEIWFSSRKLDGLGGYDIWVTKKNGSSWGKHRNIGKPINTSLNEGDPSISADKQQIYFMRCSKLNKNEAQGCKIYVSEKNKERGKGWKEPKLLPSHLNQGNTVSPRILNDNKTLFFASDRPGGKGGLDIWMSTKEEGEWSSPLNVESVNTSDDDRFISMSIRTDFAYITRKNETVFGVVKIKLPKKYRPKKVIMMMGKLLDEEGNPQSLDIRVYNKTKNRLERRVVSENKTGDFTLLLTEGNIYEVTVEDRSGELAFQTQIINVKKVTNSRREYPEIVLKTIQKGAKFNIGGIEFDTLSATLSATANFELLRLSRLIKQHKTLVFNIDIYQQYYQEDTIQHEGLTEVRYDSMMIKLPAINVNEMNNHQKDSLLNSINNRLEATLEDTTLVIEYQARMSSPDSINTWLKTPIYHNNKTPLYAKTLDQQLRIKGVSEKQFKLNALGLLPREKYNQVVFLHGIALCIRVE